MITVYLNDQTSSYIELKKLVKTGDIWVAAVDTDDNYIRIPVSSILYVEEDNDE